LKPSGTVNKIIYCPCSKPSLYLNGLRDIQWRMWHNDYYYLNDL